MLKMFILKKISPKLFLLLILSVYVLILQYQILRMLHNKTQHEAPELYIITPTYKRPEQYAELTRLSHTLRLVHTITWLVIEDGNKTNDKIEELLVKSGIKFYYMAAPMPSIYKKKIFKNRPRGVANRNKGIQWIRNNVKTGVIYFADDDNTYDLELFKEIRKTVRISAFPVGLITQTGLSSPVVVDCTFTDFYDGWRGHRKFPLDFAGFAISVEFLLQHPNANIPFRAGYEEDGFIKSLRPFAPAEFELLASCCTKILVWHTKTEKNEPNITIPSKYNNTNLMILKKIILE